MKKIFVLSFGLMLTSLTVFGQFQKGNLFLGGQVNYSSIKQETEDAQVLGGQLSKSNQFTFSPLIGLFVTEKTAVGLKFEYFNYFRENFSISGQTPTFETDRLGFGLFVRRYFPVKDWVAFYGQGEINYNATTNLQKFNSNSGSETNTKSIDFSTSLGLSFFPAKWISIDLSANPLSIYHQIEQQTNGNTTTTESKVNSFVFNLNSNSFFLGAHFFLNKK